MALFAITDITNWANISQYVGEFKLAQSKIFRGRDLDQNYPVLIGMESDILSYMYNFSPNVANIDQVANYVYSITKDIAQAKVIAGQGGSGGIVIPGTSTPATIRAVNIPFEMGVTASPLTVNGVSVTLPTAGTSTITLPLSNIMSGSLQVFKDSVLMPSAVSTLSQYCTINYSTTQAIITLQTVGNTFENSQFWEIIGLQYVAS